MATVDLKVRAQLAETLRRIAAVDFPAHFPQFMPLTMAALHSNQPTAVEAGLHALRVLAKVYEFKGAALTANPLYYAEDVLNVTKFRSADNNTSSHLQFLHDHPRAALNFIVSNTFPSLLGILKELEQTIEKQTYDVNGVNHTRAHDMQKTITKIFWSFTQYDLPLLFAHDLQGAFTDWMNTFLAILRRHVKPPTHFNGAHLSDDDFRKMPEWKVKQWISHTAYRLFQQYCNPNYPSKSIMRILDHETIIKFGDFFLYNFAAPFTEVMLESLSADRRYISPRVANLALLYLEHAISFGITYQVIKPKLAHLITDVIFPYLCISESDLALWAEDPVEYVRKTYDLLEDFNTPRAAACSLLQVLSKSCGSVVTMPLLSFLRQIMDRYAESRRQLTRERGNDFQAQETHNMLAVQKDGALLALGTVHEALVSSDQDTDYLHTVLSSYVVEEFDSEVPFLRARVCWLYGILIASENIAIDTVPSGLEGVQKCLRDKEFPVRFRAAVDIRHFLQNDEAANRIAPRLSELLMLLFSLLNDVDNTDIVATIDQVVMSFSNHITPFARDLCTRLVGTFSRAVSAEQSDGEAGFTATQCLQAVESVVWSVTQSSVQNKILVLADIEYSITEIFDHMFEEDKIEHFEESLELLAFFVHHSAVVRGLHWKYCMQVGVDHQKAFLSLIGSANGLSAAEVLTIKSVTTQAIQNDVASGGGIISLYLWSLFPKAMHAFHEWASDYSFHYLQLVDSFLSKAPRVFLCSQEDEETYIQMLLGMVARLWDDSFLDDDESAVQGSRVCALLLRYCGNLDGVSIDREVGILTELVVRPLRSKSRSLRAVSSLLTALAYLIYVSPVTTLSVIDRTAAGCVEEIFSIWISMIRQNQLEQNYDRKMSAIALSTILGSDWSQLPTALQRSIPQILVDVVQLLESLVKSAGSKRCRIAIGSGHSQVHGCVNDMGTCDGDFSSSSDSTLDTSPKVSLTESKNTKSSNEITNEILSRWYSDKMDGVVDTSGHVSNKAEHQVEHEDFEEVDEENEDGENARCYALQDVHELLYFERVVSQLSPVASRELMKALASDDTQRIQCTLHRAAELRTVMVNNVARVR